MLQQLQTASSVVIRNLRILDTTLRDGDQTAGFAFRPEQKLRLATLLDSCGVDCIEAGFPCSSPDDFTACSQIAKAGLHADIAVMSRCISTDIIKSTKVFSGMENKSKGILHLTIPVSKIQIQTKLHKTPDKIIPLMTESIQFAISLIHKVEIGFEDATRTDCSFLIDCCHAAVSAGASVINIADTTGCLLPEETAELISCLMYAVPSFSDGSTLLSIHCHNDCGLALACTLAAIKAGASQAEVTAAGLGERCGNTPLEELLYVLSSHSNQYDITTNLEQQHFAELYHTLFTYCGTDFSPLKPVTGWNTDSHASGIHQQGISADPHTYIANPVESYGLTHRRLVLSRHSGKAGLLAVVNNLWNGSIHLTDREIKLLLSEIKASPEKETGTTALCTMLYYNKIINRKPFMPGAIKVLYENNIFFVQISIQQQTEKGSGSTLESAMLNAVNKLSTTPLDISTISISRYTADICTAAKTRVYAEITAGVEKKLYAVSACKNNEPEAIFSCLLDVINNSAGDTPVIVEAD